MIKGSNVCIESYESQNQKKLPLKKVFFPFCVFQANLAKYLRLYLSKMLFSAFLLSSRAEGIG